MILQVHDELLFDLHQDERDEDLPPLIVLEAMETAIALTYTRSPIRIDLPESATTGCKPTSLALHSPAAYEIILSKSPSIGIPAIPRIALRKQPSPPREPLRKKPPAKALVR